MRGRHWPGGAWTSRLSGGQAHHRNNNSQLEHEHEHRGLLLEGLESLESLESLEGLEG